MLGVSADLGQCAGGAVSLYCFSDLSVTLTKVISTVSDTSQYKGNLFFVFIQCLLSVPSDKRLSAEVVGEFLEVS